MRLALGAATLTSAVLAVVLAALWARSHIVAERWASTAYRQYTARIRGGVLLIEDCRVFRADYAPGWPDALPHQAVVLEDSGIVELLNHAPMSVPFVPQTVAETGFQPFRSWSHRLLDVDRLPAVSVRLMGFGWGVERELGGIEVEGQSITADSITTRRLTLPLLPLSAVAAALPGCRAIAIVRRRRVRPGHCRQCGYDLRASPARCPECGRAAGPGGTGG